MVYGEPLAKFIISARTALRRLEHNSLEWTTRVFTYAANQMAACNLWTALILKRVR